MKSRIILLLSLCLLLSCGGGGTASHEGMPCCGADTSAEQHTGATRTLERKAARLLIVGMKGHELTEDNPVVRDIGELGVGGVILFENNIPRGDSPATSRALLTDLCHHLAALGEEKFMIAIDQEGGLVKRLKPQYGYPDTPSQEYLGRCDSEDSTRMYVSAITEAMSATGFNTNFAPCVDVNVNPSCPIISKVKRSYSADPLRVAHHSAYCIEEHRRQGVHSVIKHFPGHGSSATDSHAGLSDISTTWSRRELLPFRYLINRGLCDMIMIGHVFNSQIDSLYPASLSHKTICGLLRGELGWSGITITDDLLMQAISANYSLEEALLLSINAGIDMIMLTSNITGSSKSAAEEAVGIICRLVREGKIKESRIDEALSRIDSLF